MEIHKHILLESRLAVVDADRVVVPVEAVDKGLDGRLVEVTQVGCALAGLLAKHQRLGIDESERIDYDLPLDGLDGVDYDGDSAGRQLLEALLGVDIN